MIDTATIRQWLLVSETFKTLQGEGHSTGVPAFFVRLGACNLSCSWCDTPYTWAFGEKSQRHQSQRSYSARNELKRIGLTQLAYDIWHSCSDICVITGGEPLLQLLPVDQLISRVNEWPEHPKFEIETAGTLLPAGLDTYENVSLNVSPKLASSGNSVKDRYHPEVLSKLEAMLPTRFKFVIDTRMQHDQYQTISADIAEVKKIIHECGLQRRNVWLMPCGVTVESVVEGMKLLEPICIDNGWRLTGRAQVLLHGDRRGH
jgi:7-carboxy-7-deazaguanine synthase